jgi:hypothetical protein
LLAKELNGPVPAPDSKIPCPRQMLDGIPNCFILFFAMFLYCEIYAKTISVVTFTFVVASKTSVFDELLSEELLVEDLFSVAFFITTVGCGLDFPGFEV